MRGFPTLRGVTLGNAQHPLIYSGSQVHELHHIKTSPPTPLLTKERGDKAQLYRGEVKLYLTRLGNAIAFIV